jgi:hypothetical protein
MLFNFRWPVQSQTISWFSLQKFVDEICSFKRPTFGEFVSLNLNLFGENHVSDLLARPANIRTSPEHELVPDYANSKIIDCLGVVLTAHDFWSHITGCA